MGDHRRSADRGRIWRWLRRYGPPEVVGLVAALGAAAAAHPVGLPGLTALAAAVVETIAFYAVVVVRDMRARSRRGQSAAATMRDLLFEFGPAEALDGVLVRPVAMYVGVAATGQVAVGVLLGKVFADIVFYAVAIVGHELIRASPPSRSWIPDHLRRWLGIQDPRAGRGEAEEGEPALGSGVGHAEEV